MSRLTDRLDRWYYQQSFEKLFLFGIAGYAIVCSVAMAIGIGLSVWLAR